MIGRILRGILSTIAQGIACLLLTLIFLIVWLAGTVALIVTVFGSMSTLPAVCCSAAGSLCWGAVLKTVLNFFFPWWNPNFSVDDDDF